MFDSANAVKKHASLDNWGQIWY